MNINKTAYGTTNYHFLLNESINHILNVIDMVNRYPNDTELGEKIRSFVNKYYNNG